MKALPKKAPGTYRILNKENNRIYVGSAVNLYRRRIGHFNALRAKKHRNAFLQNDYNKLGEHVFEFEVLCYCDLNCLINNEQQLIDTHYDDQKQCYNICKEAQHTTGRKHSEETKRKISAALKGRDAWWTRNQVFSKETRMKLSAINDKTKKPVEQIEKATNKVIASYPSMSEAARCTGISVKQISAVCNGRYSTSGGFIWKCIE